MILIAKLREVRLCHARLSLLCGVCLSFVQRGRLLALAVWSYSTNASASSTYELRCLCVKKIFRTSSHLLLKLVTATSSTCALEIQLLYQLMIVDL